MALVSVAIQIPGSVYEAETCWYDIARWPEWVDQLARVLEVRGTWPQKGSTVVWESGPAGRGRVTERVSEYEPRSGHATEVEDESITGRQSVSFVPDGDEVQVLLRLDYRLKRRAPFSGAVDLLFIRRLMRASIARTLSQFETVVKDSRAPTFE